MKRVLITYSNSKGSGDAQSRQNTIHGTRGSLWQNDWHLLPPGGCICVFEGPLNHIWLVDFSILIQWTSPFPVLRVSGVLFHFISFRIEIPVSKQCRPWTDARSAASVLGLHCLPRSPKRDARLIWVNRKPLKFFFHYTVIGRGTLFDKMWINEYIQMNDDALKSKLISWDILSKEKENKERKRPSPNETKKLRKTKRNSDKKTFICMYYIIQSYANWALCNQTVCKENRIFVFIIYIALINLFSWTIW